jgi:hypothetical protein
MNPVVRQVDRPVEPVGANLAEMPFPAHFWIVIQAGKKIGELGAEYRFDVPQTVEHFQASVADDAHENRSEGIEVTSPDGGG